MLTENIFFQHSVKQKNTSAQGQSKMAIKISPSTAYGLFGQYAVDDNHITHLHSTEAGVAASGCPRWQRVSLLLADPRSRPDSSEKPAAVGECQQESAREISTTPC
jgi:hypothetical protein